MCNMKFATIKNGRNGDDANEREGKRSKEGTCGAASWQAAIRVSQMARDRWHVPRLSLMGLNQ